MGERLRRSAPIALAALAAVVALAWLTRGPREPTAPARPTAARPAPPHAAADLPPPEAPPGPAADDAAPPPDAEGQPSEQTGEPETGETMDDDAMAAAWATVDFAKVREAMPHNLYFELSAPTQDEAVLAARQAERDRWNVEYGKILSGTGTDEEIRAYYDLRARLSTDYIEFATYLLDHYRETLPERDVGLLELARKLHAARLEEVPRKVEEAYERKRQQDEARAAWLADEAELGGPREEH